MTNNTPTSDSVRPKRRRGIYLLPNFLTTVALLAGFYAIVAAIHDRFEPAAAAIFIAMVFDTLDGRVARLTNTQSAFGAEYDSLADVISFGIAPALIMYEWALSSLGKYGWSAAAIYTVFTALRLARFNTQVGKADKAYFQGLPSPAAAAVIVGFVWLMANYEINGQTLNWLAWFVTLFSGVLMVSNVRYRSFKDLNPHGKVPFMTVLIVVFILVSVSVEPPLVLFCIFFIYALSGPFSSLLRLRERRLARNTASSE